MTNISEMRKQHDNENRWYGDKISEVKDPRCTRIMFHNVRGLPLRGTEGLEMFIQEQSNLQIDIHAFSEHCLDTEKFHVIQTAKDILRTTYQGPSLLQLQSSSEPAVNQYKPGGTGILVLGPTASRLEPKGKGGDSMGRWCYITLRRKNLPPVTVISVYQVCPRPTNAIGNTAYHQQQRALNKANRMVHPRTAFMTDLQQFLSILIQHGHDVILGGDFNESLDDKKSGLLKLATQNNLTDPFLSRFSNYSEFGTHLHGKRRIDSVLVTRKILPAIKAIGYAPYDFSTPSDHRPLLIEFKTNLLFGKAAMELPSLQLRGVRTKDPTTVRKYVETTYHQIQQLQGFSYQSALDDNTATPQMVEFVDEIIGQCENFAETKCQRRRPEFYSQTIVKHRVKVSILQAHLNALKLHKDRTQQLRRKMQRTGIDVPLPLTQRLTRLALREARQQLQDTSRTSFPTRQAELSAKISEAQKQGDKTKLRVLKAIQKVEAGQHTYRVLQAMRNSQGESQKLDRIEIPASWPPMNEEVTSIDQLEDPKTCTVWKLITEPAEIEYYLMMRNRLHFGQAEGTPFTTSPLADELDWGATTSAADCILQGESVLNLAASQCHDLLTACKACIALDSISPELTMEEFRGKMRVWRESTTTSPSGRHLGRYKSLFVTVHSHSDGSPETTPTFEQKQNAIASLKLSVINYCIRHSYVLTRWKTIVNVMIFKEPGNYKIHRLRVIHIYEADFNAILAVKWRQLLHLAERHKSINGGQYGGRPGCEAQSLTLLEELKYDIAYLSRRSLFNFDNDATSCYDRIPVSLASLINRKYGLHRQIVSVHARTLREAQFRLKTATGVSELSYTHTPLFPIHGTGQGSGNSPCIWLLISSTLFDIHAEKSYGAKFISPDGKTQITLSMMGFVDDSTGSCNDFQPQTQASLPTLFRMMEHDAQLWNNLLHWSGGKLELQKCSFHILHFQFDPSGRPRPTIDRYDNQIHIRDSDTNERIAIPAKRAFETHKTLGHNKSPITNLQHEICTIQKKANRLALLIATSPITRQGAELAYHSVYIPSVKYSLPQSFYSRQLLEQYQAQSLSKIIAKCGYNRNTARAIIFAPKDFAGGGFIPWYLLQGEGQLTNFIKHWRTETIVSQTLRIATKWAQWQSGHEFFILDDTSTPLPHLECRWLRSLREFMSAINSRILIDNSPVAPPERQHDIYIMSYARASRRFNDKELCVLNYCRLYLHVTTISEILTADGKNIIPEIFHCHREPWFDDQTYVSLQRRPTNYHVRYQWQRFCRLLVTSEGKLAESINLGKWITSGAQLRRRRQTYITDASPHKVFHWRYGSYWEYCKSDSNPTIYLPIQPTQWRPISQCTPIQAQEHTGGLIVLPKLFPSFPVIPRPRISKTFTDYIHTLPTWEQDLLLGVAFSFSPYEITHRLQSIDNGKKLYLVSDGSQRHEIITYGWVFGCEDGTVYAEHSGHGYGTPTSHRAEAWGMLSGTLFIFRLLSYTSSIQHSPPLPLVFFSDNNGLIQRITRRHAYTNSYPTATLEPDWDIVEQIYQTSSQLPMCTITHQWVQGHQDNTRTDLPTEAQYNIRADLLAGDFHVSSHHSHNPEWLLPAERCRLIIDKTHLHGHYLSAIRKAYSLPPLFTFLTHLHKWPTDTWRSIDWDAFRKAVSTSQETHIQLVKLIHNKLPTRMEQAKSQSHIPTVCHYCKANETFSHLLCCDNPISNKFRTALIERLEEYFDTTSAPYRLRTSFLHSQTYWYHECMNHQMNKDQLASSYTVQHQIGWPLLLKGFFSTEWKNAYITQSNGSPAHHPTDFISGLIKVLWTSQLLFWQEHLANIHREMTTTASLQVTDKLQEYKAKIRLLHEQKHLCVPAHQEMYFYPDVEQFLMTATMSQMKHYLCQYEPAITHSKRAAQKHPVRPIFTFPGFHAYRLRRPAPRLHPPTQHQTPLSTSTPSDTRGAPIPHKHSRWKQVSHRARTILDYFLQPPDPG